MVTRMFGFLAVTFLVLSVCTTPTNSQKQVRNVVSARNKIWRRGEIVYEFSSILDDSKKAIIREAMQEIMNDTFSDRRDCVQFLPRQGFHQNDDDYIYITTSNDGSCSENSVGMKGGIQRMYVGDDCLTKTSCMANLLLTIGLYREHQRPDRDQYITVHEDNIKQGYQHEFNKEQTSTYSEELLRFPYDFDSITHFGPYEHAIDKTRPTITSNVTGAVFGGKTRLSRLDVEKIQTMYGCGRDDSFYSQTPYNFIHCSFENPMCGLVNDVTPDAVWEKRSETTLIYGDHSRGAGHFMYSDSSGARLLSLKFFPQGTRCIELFYLNSYQITPNVSKNSTFILTAKNILDKQFFIFECCENLANQWTRFSVTVSAGFRWRLYIEARVDYHPNNGIAIDDVIVSNNACERPTSAAVDLTHGVNSCEN